MSMDTMTATASPTMATNEENSPDIEDLMPPPPPLQPQQAPEVIFRFLTEEARRARYAAQSREVIHAALDRGEQPQGHRVEWVVEAAARVTNMLLREAERFNATYPYDIVVLGDFLDALETSKGKFMAIAGEDEDT